MKRDRLITGTVLLCALLVRIIPVGLIRFFTSDGIVFREDADPLMYLNGARSLLATGVNPFDFFPPLQFLFIAAFLKIGGGSTTAVLAAQAMLGWLTVAAMYLLSKALFGRQTALVAALVSGFYPNFVFYGLNFYSETLALFFIVFSFLLVQYFCASRNTAFLLGAGALWGAASLTRGGLHYFSVFIAIAIASSLAGRGWKARLQPAGAFLVSTYLVLLALGLAAHPAGGQFSFNSKSGIGSVLHGANRITTSCIDYGDVRGNIFYFINHCGEQWPEGSQIYSTELLASGSWNAFRVFLSFIAHDPVTYLTNSFRKLSCFWSPNQGVIHYLKTRNNPVAAVLSGWLSAGISLWYVVIICGGVCGIALAGGPFRLLVVFFILFYCLLIFFTVGNAKLRLPLMPFFMIYAASFAAGCWMQRVGWKSLASPVWVVMVLLVFIGNSIHKYGEIRLSPSEVEVRKVELCTELGFPRTALFLLERGGRREFDLQQQRRLKDVEESIKESLRQIANSGSLIN